MAPKALLKPAAAQIIEVVPEGSAGHSLWLAPRTGWRSPPTPGQFLMLWLPQPPAADPSAKRACDNVPMSVAGWEPGRVMVTVADLGPTTHALLQCAEGEWLGVTGPLGNGFHWQARQNLLLVAGGVGAPPLRYLAQRAAAQGCRVHTLLGARNAGSLFNRADLDRFSDTLEVATDDGSAGHHGFVTELLEGAATAITARTGTGPDLLAACGPEPMLVAALQWAEGRPPLPAPPTSSSQPAASPPPPAQTSQPLPAQLCLERYMACGVGVCGVCTVDEWLVCHDGPVLTGEQLRSSREFGRVVRGPGGVVVKNVV